MNDTIDDEQTAAKQIPYRSPQWMALYWETTMMDIVAIGDPADVGLYFTMMGLAWLRGDGSIPADMRDLKRLLRSKLPDMHGRTFNHKVPPLLGRYFELRERSKRVQAAFKPSSKTKPHLRKSMAYRQRPYLRNRQYI